MIEFFDSGSPAARAMLAIAIDVILKATVLLVLTIAAHAALGRRRALVRSALWNACLAGLLLMPAASYGLPPLRLAVLPIVQTPIAMEHGTAELVRPTALPTGAVTPALAASTRLSAVSLAVVNPRTIVPTPSSLGPRDGKPWQPARADIVVAIYLGIAAFLVVKLGCALAAVGRLKRECVWVAEPIWTAAVQRWRSQLQIARRVNVVRSPRMSVPMVLGWRRPTLVLPSDLVEPRIPRSSTPWSCTSSGI